MNISTVNELIASLESAGELSIREQNFLKLAKEFKQLAAENVAAKKIISECREYFIAGVMNRIRPTNEGYPCRGSPGHGYGAGGWGRVPW